MSVTANNLEPVLRFPDCKGDWVEAVLGDVFESSRDRGQQGLPILSVTMNDGLVKRDELDRKSETSLSAEEHLLVRKGDIAYNMMRMWQGAYGRADIDGIVSPAYVVLRARGDTDTAFMDYKLARNRSIYLFWAYSYGLTKDRLRLYAQDCLNIPHAFPEPAEQQKIAVFLTAVDKRIAQLRDKQRLQQTWKKGVMQQLFSQTLRFKDDNGRDFPDWEETKLGDIGKFYSGSGFSQKEQGGKDGIPFYKVSDMNSVGNEIHLRTANNYVSDQQIHDNKYKVIDEDAVVFAKVGAAIFLDRKRLAKGFLIDNNMMAFVPSFSIAFAIHLFSTIRLAKYAQVGALPSYNASDLSSVKVSLPNSAEEQTKIANCLTAIDRQIDAVARQVELMQTFKQGLLQQMFV